MAKSVVKDCLVKPISLAVEAYGTEYGGLTMDDITNGYQQMAKSVVKNGLCARCHAQPSCQQVARYLVEECLGMFAEIAEKVDEYEYEQFESWLKPGFPVSSGDVAVGSQSPRLSAREKGQQRQQALHFSRAMQRHTIVPDLITYCAAASACGKGQQRQQVLLFLRARQRHAILSADGQVRGE